jgi:SRSO17 transposase
MHQSLHHLVADAPWDDNEMLAEVWRQVLPSMQKHGPVVAWIVDDVGFLQEVWCRMRSAVSRPEFPKRLSLRPSLRLLWDRSGRLWNRRLPAGVVLVDAGYGNGTPFREAITKLAFCGLRSD